jgi:hypothetical protein
MLLPRDGVVLEQERTACGARGACGERDEPVGVKETVLCLIAELELSAIDTTHSHGRSGCGVRRLATLCRRHGAIFAVDMELSSPSLCSL